MSGVTQTTTTSKRVITSSSDGAPGTTTSEILRSNTTTVSPETNKLGNALSGFLKNGNSGTPFLTLKDVATASGRGGKAITALKFTVGVTPAGKVVGGLMSAFGFIGKRIPGAGSIKNRHFFNVNVSGNVLHPLHPFYDK